MPYLDWSATRVGVHSEPPGAGSKKLRLTLELSTPEYEALVKDLSSVLPHGPGELRVELPEGWSLFFKARPEGESRLLAAHPESDQWVGTIALHPDQGRALLERLKARPRELAFTAIGPVIASSNLEFVLKLKV